MGNDRLLSLKPIPTEYLGVDSLACESTDKKDGQTEQIAVETPVWTSDFIHRHNTERWVLLPPADR